jgi:hypothetical protein
MCHEPLERAAQRARSSRQGERVPLAACARSSRQLLKGMALGRRQYAATGHRVCLVGGLSALCRRNVRDKMLATRRIMGDGQCVHDPAPDAGPPPSDKAVVAGGVRTEVIGQVAPWPDRNTQKVSLRTRRSFTRGTPRGLFGSIGLMSVHSWSVSS